MLCVICMWEHVSERGEGLKGQWSIVEQRGAARSGAAGWDPCPGLSLALPSQPAGR